MHAMVGRALSQAAAHNPSGSPLGPSVKASAQAAQDVFNLQGCSAENSADSQVRTSASTSASAACQQGWSFHEAVPCCFCCWQAYPGQCPCAKWQMDSMCTVSFGSLMLHHKGAIIPGRDLPGIQPGVSCRLSRRTWADAANSLEPPRRLLPRLWRAVFSRGCQRILRVPNRRVRQGMSRQQVRPPAIHLSFPKLLCCIAIIFMQLVLHCPHWPKFPCLALSVVSLVQRGEGLLHNADSGARCAWASGCSRWQRCLRTAAASGAQGGDELHAQDSQWAARPLPWRRQPHHQQIRIRGAPQHSAPQCSGHRYSVSLSDRTNA